MTAFFRRTVPTALVALACSAGTAGAQVPATPGGLANKSLEELLAVEVDSVTGASRHEQRLADAPASVTIVTAEDIRTFGWRTLAEVLQSVRGFYVTDDRSYSYLGVRGFGRPTDYNNRVLITIDGHRVNDNVYDAGSIGTDFPIDLALVDRVEVIRGPGSALYGTSAFFAVINVITRRGTGTSGDAAFEGGSLGSYRGRVTYGWDNDQGRDVLLSVTRFTSDGQHELYYPEFDAPGIGDGRVVGLDGEQATHVYAAASLGRWRVQALTGSRLKDVPTASWGTAFGDRAYETGDTRGWVSGSYTRPIGKATVEARGYYDFYRYNGVFPFADGNAVVRADDNARMDLVGGEFSVRRTLWDRHHVVAGAEHRSNLRQDQAFIYDGSLDIDVPRSSQEYAAYVQDEIALSPRWQAIVGGRFDHWSHGRKGTGRPRLGLIYKTDYDTAIKVLYGEGYRVANMYELYYYSNTSASMVNLAPESLRTTELVLERFIRRRVRMAVSAYYTSITDLIDQTLSDTGEVTHFNSESARARGVEVDAEGRWSSGVLVRGSFSLQANHVAQTGEVMSNSPHQLATFQASVPAWHRQLRLATDTTYTAWRRTAVGGRLPSHRLTNASLLYEPAGARFTVGASIYNLFDRQYSHPVGLEFVQPSIEQNGRTFAVRANVHF